MSPYLKVLLQEAMTRNLVQDMVMVERLTATPDGRGGTTTTWRQVSEFKGRMVNQNNNEMVMAGGMKVVCNWYLVAPANADIQSKDRIRLHDDYAHYYDVVGTDSGQSNLLVMHCALKEHFS